MNNPNPAALIIKSPAEIKDKTPIHPALVEHAAAIKALGKRVVADVIEIGSRLITCRAILKDDGRWRAWLDSELGLSPQTAGRFTQVYHLSQGWGRSKLEHINLPVSALYAIAAPSTPADARDAVLERAQAGEILPVAEIKRTIEIAKGHQQPARRKRALDDDDRGGERRRRVRGGEHVGGGDYREGHDHHDDGAARGDIGAGSAGECERLRARNSELENEVHRLKCQIISLDSEIGGLKAQLCDVPGFLDRTGSAGKAAPSTRELEAELKHVGGENAALRSQVRELTQALANKLAGAPLAELNTELERRSLTANKLAAVPSSELITELERRSPARISAMKAVRRAFNVPEGHPGPTLELKGTPITDEATKH